MSDSDSDNTNTSSDDSDARDNGNNSDSDLDAPLVVPPAPPIVGPEAVATESDTDSVASDSEIPEAPAPYIADIADAEAPPRDLAAADAITERAEAEVDNEATSGGGRSALLAQIKQGRKLRTRKETEMAIVGIENLWPKDDRDCKAFLQARWETIRGRYMEPLRAARSALRPQDEQESIDDVVRKAMLSLNRADRSVQEQTVRRVLDRVLSQCEPTSRDTATGGKSKVERKSEFKRLLNEVLPFTKIQEELDLLCEEGRYGDLKTDWENFPATCESLPHKTVKLRDWVRNKPEYQGRQRREDVAGHEDDEAEWGYEPVMDVDEQQFVHAVREGPDAVRGVLQCRESELEKADALGQFRQLFRDRDRIRQLVKWDRYKTLTADALFEMQQPYVYNRAMGEASNEVRKQRDGENAFDFQERRERAFLSKVRSYWRSEFDAVRPSDGVPLDPPWVQQYMIPRDDDGKRTSLVPMGVLGRNPKTLAPQRYSELIDFPLMPPSPEEIEAATEVSIAPGLAVCPDTTLIQSQLEQCSVQLDTLRQSPPSCEAEMDAAAAASAANEAVQLRGRIAALEQQLQDAQAQAQTLSQIQEQAQVQEQAGAAPVECPMCEECPAQAKCPAQAECPVCAPYASRDTFTLPAPSNASATPPAAPQPRSWSEWLQPLVQ
jgi:hypothetical protein